MITCKFEGVKCDNPACDFRDKTAKYEDRLSWLNRPCPKCGQNLLTEKDLRAMEFMLTLVGIINIITKPFAKLFESDKKTILSVDMDGTGKVVLRRRD